MGRDNRSVATSNGHAEPRAATAYLPATAVLVLTTILAPSSLVEGQIPFLPPVEPKGMTVAVLPFEDKTDDPNQAHWRYVASGLLKNQLDDVNAIRIPSEGAIRYALRQVDLSAGDAIDPNLARTMGEHIEAHRVVWGSYRSENGLWRVDARMLNVATGELSRSFSAVCGDWFDLRDTLSEQVLGVLDVTPTEEERRKMAKRWTSSSETLSWYGRAYFLQEQGRPVTELNPCFHQALAADPNCVPACVGLAATLANQGKMGPAEDMARRALQLESDHANAYAVLGAIVGSQHRMDEAKEAFRQACREAPDDADHLIHLAEIYALEGKRAQATALLQRAACLDPTSAMAHAVLAHAYAGANDEQAALREMKEAVYFMPEKIAALEVYLKLANTCERLARTSEAIEHYTRIKTLAGRLGMAPEMIRTIERQIRRLETLLSPTFIQAAMPQRYTEQEFDRILRNRLTETERELVANPFSCTEPMKQWARELVGEATTDFEKARAILNGLAGRLSVRTEAKSRTAAEVFAAWNDREVRLVCMDHAVLFVALARAVDLDAFFTQVNRDPDGTVVTHACAAVFDGPRALLADSSWRWFGAPHQEYAILNDLQTAAFLCFNNRTDDAGLLSVFRAGLKLWPDSVQGRLSVVSALHGTGHTDEARQVFATIDRPSQGFEASVYWRTEGMFAEAEQDFERAEELLRKAVAICSTQAYSYFQLGRICLRRGRLVEARAEFRHCLRSNPDAMAAGMARRVIAQINEKIGFELTTDTVVPETETP